MSPVEPHPLRFTYPFAQLVAPSLRILLGKPSLLSRDAAFIMRGIHPPPRVLGAENIPSASPFVLTLNHYDRPGMGTWWAVSTIVCTVAERRRREPRELHFAMAREWWYPDTFGRLFKQPLTRWAFGQLSKAYGLILLPPILQDNEFKGEGALGIRRALALTRGQNPDLVAIAPEGRTGENLALRKPPSGAGIFIAMLTHDEIPCLPVGIYEEDGSLIVKFGVPYRLSSEGSRARDQRDAAAACQVMVQLGKLLPQHMWGVYHAEIERAVRSQ